MRNYRVTRRMVVGGFRGKTKPPNRWTVIAIIVVIMFVVALITKHP